MRGKGNDGGLMSNQRSLAQTLALLFGVAFLGAGVLGFIPGITTNLGDIQFAGSDSPAELLGIFQVSILHNIVHLLFGIAGIALSRSWESARTYLLGSGVIYLVLFVYGLLVSAGSSANFVPINMADDWLHLALGVTMLGSWYLTRTGDEIATTATTTT
jgi:Domain of unknown function (DUF4383)